MANYGNAAGFGMISKQPSVRRGLVWGLMIIGALLAFELFNYSTTEFALSDLLGDLSFVGIRWATILAIAFCGIDFAGIARLFTPERGADEPKEVWYLLGAWMLAAIMNAMLTWWGVSIAILGHQSLGNEVVERDVLLKAVPVFVAVMVWLSRVLIIGTFSIAGERLFSQADQRSSKVRMKSPAGVRQKPLPQAVRKGSLPKPAFRPKPKPAPRPDPAYGQPALNNPSYNPRPEPTYHPIGARARTNSTKGGYQ